MNSETERNRAIATDLDGVKREWFNAGFLAGCESERARIKTVQEQAMPGHESLLERMKFDGVTTAEQAAVIIVAAEKRKLGRIAIHLREDAGQPAAHTPFETINPSTPQAIAADMSKEDMKSIAHAEWEAQPKLRNEFSGERQYIAFRTAEAQGRIRLLGKRKGKVN